MKYSSCDAPSPKVANHSWLKRLGSQPLVAEAPWKPTKEQLAAAANKTLPDLITNQLDVLFCGINPGLYTAAIGHHFGRPGNRFWKVLYLAGFTPRLLTPFEEQELLGYHVGISNFVRRATATAAELSDDEFLKGAKVIERKVFKFAPKALAILGVQAYRKGFIRPKATVGLQTERIGSTAVWVLPNPSGLQAHYQLDDMVELYSEIRTSIGRGGSR